MELVLLPCNQKALRGEMQRRTLAVMCCRANTPGPSLKSSIKKKKKKSVGFHKTVQFHSLHRRKKKAAVEATRGRLSQSRCQAAPWCPPMCMTHSTIQKRFLHFLRPAAPRAALISSQLFSLSKHHCPEISPTCPHYRNVDEERGKLQMTLTT